MLPGPLVPRKRADADAVGLEDNDAALREVLFTTDQDEHGGGGEVCSTRRMNAARAPEVFPVGGGSGFGRGHSG